MKAILTAYRAIRYGDWYAGCELWEGKPMLYIGKEWYDGWYYAAHLGPFYIECHC